MQNQSYSPQRYKELVDEIFAKVNELAELKGGEYSGDKDRLANFRRNGIAAGVSMETCWFIYVAKHWDAIAQYVKDMNIDKTRQRMEPIEGRALDMIVYLTLFLAMCEERNA